MDEKLDLPESLLKKSTEDIAQPMVSEERAKFSTSPKPENPVKSKITLEKPTVTLGKRTSSRRNSALSLSSIHVNDAEIIKGDEIDEDNLDKLPKDPFTEETFLKTWNSYIEQLHEEGEKIFASILKADTPTIQNNMICVTYPNKMMKAELIRVKPKALRHLRKVLNNYSIDFKIAVNEENIKKFAYTPQEKYELLKSKNEALATLRKAFNLEL